MTMGFVLAPDSPRLSEIREAHDSAAFVHVARDAAEVTRVVAEASRVPLESLYIDVAILADTGDLRRYRVARPRTRILLGLAADTVPPHPVIAQAVALGIYDLVPADMSIADALQRRPTFADVAGWTGETELPGERRPLEKTIAVERRVAISTRPVLIAVFGTAGGVGTTTAAVGVAAYLAHRGHTVALAEYGLPSLAQYVDGVRGVSMFAADPEPLAERTIPDPAELVKRRQWAYVVADLGAEKWPRVKAADPDLAVVVLPGSWTREPRWRSLPIAVARTDPLVALVGPGADGPRVAEEWTAATGRPGTVWAPGKKNRDDGLGALLASVLPDAPQFRFPRRWMRGRAHG